MPSWFIRARTCSPYSVRPVSAGSVEPPPRAIVAIGELGHALPQLVERVDVIHRPKMIRILLADDDPEFPLGLGAGNIGRTAHANEVLGIGVDEGVPTGDIGRRLGVDVSFDVADRRVEDGDAGILEALEI